MRVRTAFFVIFAGIATLGLVHAQRPFHDYVGETPTEYQVGEVPLPPDWDQPAEFTRGRLKYTRVQVHPSNVDTGWMGWATDYPKGDRHFLEGIRRLTLINSASVEHVTEADGSDDIYNWPFMYVEEVGHWHLFQDEADQIREYLLRGGFLMTDDFHGTVEWENFLQSLYKIFATRPINDLPNSHEVFHVLYDLDHRTQIPGAQYLQSHIPYEFDGFDPQWRAISDDKGRIMFAICHNMDMSDAIEHSDDPRYPAEWANEAYRIAVNYVVYDLTH